MNLLASFLLQFVVFAGNGPATSLGVIQFVTRPQNVSVKAGDNTTLRCAISGYDQGSKLPLNWAINGEITVHESPTLLKGLARHSIVGNTMNGEYDLLITNVRYNPNPDKNDPSNINDDGVYSCQIPELELGAKAYLTVLVPPSNLSLENVREGEKMEVKEGQGVEVKCKATGAKPAPTIKWYRDGINVEDVSCCDIRISVTEEHEGDTELVTGTSSLSFTAGSLDNHATYTCQVFHDALPETAVMRANFSLNVLYPPGYPVISGYNTGDILKISGNAEENERLTLSCKVDNGNPIPSLFWYRNGLPIPDANTYVNQPAYTVSEYQFQVGPEDNGAEYTCEASNMVTVDERKATAKLKVFFGPSKVEVRGPETAAIGTTVSLHCETDASHPPAKIEWWVNNKAFHNLHSKTVPVDSNNPFAGSKTSSKMTLDLHPNERNLNIRCSAEVEDIPNSRIEDSFTVKVQYPPHAISISGYDPEFEGALVLGDELRLSCLAEGGEPLATLNWFKGVKRVEDLEPQIITQDSVRREVVIRLTESDNDAKYRCQATSPALQEPMEEQVLLNVHYPPKDVNITLKPGSFHEGQTGNLLCESGASNPSPIVKWFRKVGTPEEEELNTVGVFNNTKSHGGWAVRGKHQLTLKAEHDGETFTCKAENPELPGKSVAKSVTLSVFYKPHFEQPSPQIVSILEHEPLQKVFEAKGNPNVIAYSWTKDGVPLNGMNGVDSYGGVLNSSAVQRHHAGNYSLKATNAEGDSYLVVQLFVKFPAEITFITNKLVKEEGQDVTLECKADGYPIIPKMVHWERPNHKMTNSEVETYREDGTAVLFLKSITRNHTGIYYCVGSNNVGMPYRESTSVFVKQPPMMRQSSPQKLAGVENGVVTFTCKATGYPTVEFRWFRMKKGGLEEEALEISDKHKIYEKATGFVSYESMLEITKVEKADHGRYKCFAFNGVDYDAFTVGANTTFLLTAVGKPDKPYDVKVVNYTSTTVSLGWKPGFDGGKQTTFKIRYKEKADSDTEYQILSGINEPRYVLRDLDPNKVYMISVGAENEIGFSQFTSADYARTTASAKAEELMEEGIPRLVMLILFVLLGVLLLFLAVAVIFCLLQRHRRKRLKEKAATARLMDAGPRPVQMYGSGGGNEGQHAGLRPDSQPMYTNDGRIIHSEFSDENSVRTVIEVDANGQPFYVTERISPGSQQTYLLDENAALVQPELADSPTGALYAETLRANSLQRRLATGNYPSTSTNPQHYPQLNYVELGKSPLYASPEPPPPAPRQCQPGGPGGMLEISDENIPPPMGPLRNLSEELSQYAPYQHQYQSNGRNGLFKRYSPTGGGETGSSGGIPTLVQATTGTPYAEVRPIVTQNSSMNPSSQPNQQQLYNPVSSGPNGSLPPNNNPYQQRSGSPLLSTFSAPRAKPEYMDLDQMSGDLV